MSIATPPLSPVEYDNVDEKECYLKEQGFMFACQMGEFDVISATLEEHPSFVNLKNPLDNNATPLHYAVLRKDARLVWMLLSAGADPNAMVEKTLSTPLHWAAGLGLIGICSLLLMKGGAPGMPDGSGYMACHLAAQHGHTLAVLYLLSSGNTPVDAVDSGRRTCLHWAAIKNHPDLVVALLAFVNLESPDSLKQFVNMPDDEYGMTALHWAAHSCFADVCKELLRFGADPLIRDKKDRLPLDLAAAKGFQKYYELALLDSGMIIHSKSELMFRIDPNRARFWIGKVLPHIYISYSASVFGYATLYWFPALVLLPLLAHYMIGRFIMPTIPLVETEFMSTLHWNWLGLGWIIVFAYIVPGTLCDWLVFTNPMY